MNTEQIILDNQKLVYSATKYFNKHQDKEDLIQEGNLGFIKAINNYNEDKGAKLTTYAYGYILGEMRRHNREDKGIKISRDITKLNLKIEKATILLTQRLMREPSISEVSHYLEIPEIYITEAIKSCNTLQSLNEPVNSSGDKQLILEEVIPNTNQIDLDSLIDLKNALQKLTPFEKQLIEVRYMKDLTQSETSKLLGISQVQVSRNEQKILQKLNRLVS